MNSEHPPMLVDCPDWGAVVQAIFRTQYDWSGGGPDELPLTVTLVTCPLCHRPILVGEEFYGYDDGVAVASDPFRLWPPREKQLSFRVPEPIRHSFAEAQICLRAKAYMAVAVMCRKTIESVSKEHGAKSRNLSKALSELRDNQTIDQRLFEWADALRVLGNDAAHGVTVKVSLEEAQDALDFTEAVIDYLFVFKDRFESFQRRRESAVAGPIPDAGASDGEDT